MSQSTRHRVVEKIDRLDEGKSLPFTEILDAEMVEHALAAERVAYNRSIYTPFVTLCTFLSQVLDPDHSCRAAVARVVVWTALQDRQPCSEQTGTYCDARLRLPLGVVERLVRRTGHECPQQWWWWRRRADLEPVSRELRQRGCRFLKDHLRPAVQPDQLVRALG